MILIGWPTVGPSVETTLYRNPDLTDSPGTNGANRSRVLNEELAGPATLHSRGVDRTPTGRSILGVLVTSFGIQGIGLLTGIFVARGLGVEGRGELAAIILWPSIIVYLGDLGLPLAYVYESARERSQIGSLVANAVLLVLGQWLILSVVGGLIILVALGRYDETVRYTAVAFLWVYIPLNLLSRYLHSINQGIGAFRAFNAVRITVAVSYAVGLVFVTSVGVLSVRSAVIATLASNVCALAVVIFVSRSSLRAAGRPRPDRALLGRTLRYGFRGHIGNLTPVDSMQIDLLIVTALLTASDAGLYAVAAAAAMVVRAQGTSIGMVALPTVAAGQTDEERRAAVGQFFRLSLLLNFVTAATIVVTARFVVPALFGNEFAPAVGTVQILAIGITLASLRQVLGDCLRGLGRPGASTVAELVSLVVALVALAIFIPLFGIEGAAIGVSTSYAAALAVVMAMARGSGIRLRNLLVPRIADLRGLTDLAPAWLPSIIRRVRTPLNSRRIGSVAFVCCAVLLAAACGALATVAQPSLRGLLIATIAVVLLVPVVLRVFQRRFTLFEPLTVMCIALFIMFVVRPILLLANGQTTHLGYDINPNFDEALLVALAGSIAFVVGYFTRVAARVGRVLPPVGRSGTHLDATVVYALGLFAVGMLLYAAFLAGSGGTAALESLLSGRRPEQNDFYLNSSGYLYQGLFLCGPAGLLVFSAGLEKRRAVLMLGGALMMVPLAMLGGATGGRLSLMVLLTPPLTFLILRTSKRPPAWMMVTGVYFALTVGLGFLGQQRDAEGRTQSRPTLLQEAVIHPERSLETVFLRNDTEMFDTLVVLTATVPERLPYQHGSSLTDSITRAVPRSVWANKPLDANDQFITTVWPAHYASSRASAASSVIGNLYQDSGLWTVGLGMTVIGVAARALWEWLRRWPNTTGVQLMFASALPLLVVLARGNIQSTLSIALFTLIPLAGGIIAASRKDSAGSVDDVRHRPLRRITASELIQ